MGLVELLFGGSLVLPVAEGLRAIFRELFLPIPRDYLIRTRGTVERG